VDFAPRTIALMLLAWLPIGFIYLVVLSQQSREIGTVRDGLVVIDAASIRKTYITFGLLLTLWLGTSAWRRLSRMELAPGGAYEAWRSGVAWFLMPALMIFFAKEYYAFQSINPLIIVTSVIASLLLTSLVLWRALSERIACFCAGLLLMSMSLATGQYLSMIDGGTGSTIVVETLAVSLVLVVLTIAGLVLSAARRRREAKVSDDAWKSGQS
jgi:hypothetical protein